MIRHVLKRVCSILGVLIVSPLILLTWLEAITRGKEHERVFGSCGEILSLWPTTVGAYLRKAYYWAVCKDVSLDAHFLFGSILAHRDVVIRSGTVVGACTFIGYADIAENVLMGARVSIISGKYQHGRPGHKAEGREIVEEHTVNHIGKDSWIGQDAVILSSIGENCTVGAGSVVYRDVPDNTTVMGNPARKVNI